MRLFERLAVRVPPSLVEAGGFAREQLESMRADASRYPAPWYLKVGFWATATYRVGRWARTLRRPVRWLVLTPQKLLNEFFHIVYQIDISPYAEIGPGLALIHPRNIMIGHCKIGQNCLIFHEVTLGMNANSSAFPELGDGVDIYAGARVIGGIRLGDDVKVGANCVVSQSVADGCTVVVARNRVIPKGLVDAFGPRRPAASPPPESRAGATEPAAVVNEPEPRPAARESVQEALEEIAEPAQ